MDPNNTELATKQKSISTIIPGLKQTLAERLPQLASTTATGLVSLSLGLALANIVQGAPEDVFTYVAGLAPNFISDMLLRMHRQEQPVDVEAIAQAVAKRLNEPEVRHLADELQILDSLAEVMQGLQMQSKQLRQVSQAFIQEMQDLKTLNWTIPQNVETNISMVAQGNYIAQATEGSTAVVAYQSQVTINQSMKRVVRVLIGNTGDDLLKQRDAIIKAIGEISLADFEIEVKTSLAVSSRQVNLNMRTYDVYIGLLSQQQEYESSIIEIELNKARELDKPVLLYYQELGSNVDEKQQALIDHLQEYGYGYLCEFGVFDDENAWAQKAQDDLMALLPSPDFTTRQLPFSGRRGLIASIGRSPGAATGLYYALTESRNLPVDYVWTVSTTDPEVSRAVDRVGEELASKVEYQDFRINVQDFRNDHDIIQFKREFVRLLTKARAQGDALAIGVTGGRTVMGALIAQISQVEAPANSAFYQLSVPNGIEEDGRYPRFGNQDDKYQEQLLNPKKHMVRVCHLVEISFNHFYEDVYEGM
ncbi:CRISPR-associated ring nuclease [Chloroflexota bacterium]